MYARALAHILMKQGASLTLLARRISSVRSTKYTSDSLGVMYMPHNNGFA